MHYERNAQGVRHGRYTPQSMARRGEAFPELSVFSYLVQEVVGQSGGNCNEVAEILGVNLATVYRRIKILKLTHLLKRPRD